MPKFTTPVPSLKTYYLFGHYKIALLYDIGICVCEQLAYSCYINVAPCQMQGGVMGGLDSGKEMVTF